MVQSVIWHWAEKNCGQNSENVYQCPFQLCLQFFQLSGASGWILLAFFLEGNKVEEGTDSTHILFSSGGQAVCHATFQTQGIFGKGTLCLVKLSLAWYWHNKVDSQAQTLSWTVCLEDFWAHLLLRLFSCMDITLQRLLPMLGCQEKICEKKIKSQIFTSSSVFCSHSELVQLKNSCVPVSEGH